MRGRVGRECAVTEEPAKAKRAGEAATAHLTPVPTGTAVVPVMRGVTGEVRRAWCVHVSRRLDAVSHVEYRVHVMLYNLSPTRVSSLCTLVSMDPYTPLQRAV